VSVADLGVGGHHSEVGGQQDLAAAGQRVPLDDGDRHERPGGQRVDDRADLHQVALHRRFVPEQRLQVLQVGAGGQRAAGAAQHQHRAALARGDPEGVPQPVQHTRAQRVQRLRPVDQDARHRPVHLDADVHWLPLFAGQTL
jgi:hypothetical protein